MDDEILTEQMSNISATRYANKRVKITHQGIGITRKEGQNETKEQG